MLDTERGTDTTPVRDWERERALSVLRLRSRRRRWADFFRRLLAPRAYLRQRDSKLARLARHPLLAGCSRAERRLFAWYSDQIECEPGDVLVRQGWIGHWFFLIDDGVVDVIQNSQTVTRLHGGQYFGELALFAGGAQPVTIRAHSHIKLFVTHRRHLAVLIDRIPNLRWELIASMARRLRATSAAQGIVPVLTPEFLVDASLFKPHWALGGSRRLTSSLRKLAFGAALLIPAGFVLVNYQPPVAVIAPGPTYDISRDIVISGVASETPSGKYLLTSIRVERPNLLGFIAAAIRADREVVPIPHDEDVKWVRLQQEALFVESRMLAAAAAAKVQGMEVSLSGTGALVTGLIPDSPAAAVLQRGDVIVAINGASVRVATDAAKLIKSHKGDALLKLDLERSGRSTVVYVPRAPELGGSESILAIGAFVLTRDLEVNLPFRVDFKDRDIGGPSAGLVYALAISDMLNGADYARGRIIAATGTIDSEGHVGPVGGVRYKGEASQRAGAGIFLVPSAFVDETAGQPLLVFGINSLLDALSVLVESQI